MTTHAVGHVPRGEVRAWHGLSVHWAWLGCGFALAFAVPFLLADVVEIRRDVFYGLYALAVAGLFALWSRSTDYDLAAAMKRHWLAALLLGLASAGMLAGMVVRTEDATPRPQGFELVGAVAWRGILYGVTDGLLLSVFPILVVFAAFAGTRLDRTRLGKIAIGIVALAASLAHELRQPLAAVLHNAQAELRNLASAEPDSQQIKAMLSDVVRDAKRAAAVINGLQAFVRREEPARDRVEVASALRELLDLLHSELVKQGVEVHTHIEDVGWVMADRAQLQQVMLNLVMNAIDAMRERPDGQRRLGISIGRAGGDEIRVAVSDTGMGIAREDLDKLFDVFWTTKASGMGLGLAICRSIVEFHGGTIKVQPNDERGMTAVFTLPTNQPRVMATAAAS